MQRQVLLGAIALCLLAFGAHYPALSAGLLWDDDAIVGNSVFDSVGGLLDLWLTPGIIPLEQHYWPVTYTSFWIEARLWGLETVSMHATNMVLHAVNCVLLWRLIARLNHRYAWWSAALFAVHPVHVESVAWIIERKDVLSAAMYLIAAHAFFCIRENQRSTRAVAIMLLAYVLGTWSKSVVLSLPVTLAFLLWARTGALSARAKRLLLGTLMVGAGLAAFDLTRTYSLDPLDDLSLGLVDRVQIAGRGLSFYASSTFAPTNLTPIVPFFDLDSSGLWLHGLGWSLVLVALFLLRSRIGRWPLASLVIWIATLGPTLGLIEFSWMRHSFVADRYQYLASAALISIVVAGIGRSLEQRGKVLTNGVFATVAVVLGYLCVQYSGVFSNAPSHARRIVETNPESWAGHFNLAQVYREAGDLESALLELDRSIVQRPAFASTHNNRGDVLMSLDRLAEAEQAFMQALSLEPDLFSAHNNFGLLLTKRGAWKQAEVHLLRAVELSPKQAAFRVNLGLLYAKSGRLEEARLRFEETLQLEPGHGIAVRSLETIEQLQK